jgi:succinate dehydrogenase / fumarate reductase flavoprotein subunit
MRIYPAVHYTMGGLWVDYNLMTSVPGLYAIGESNFADHGANRLGASALMQCLADGYFIIPVTIGDYLSRHPTGEVGTDHSAFKQQEAETQDRIKRLLSIGGKRSSQSFHRELGQIMWNNCGISRNREMLEEGLKRIPELREEFWNNLNLPGNGAGLNQSLEHAGRVADFLEFGELMCLDALTREESCGCHFREEYQTEESEALRNDEEYAHVSVFEYKGEGETPELNKENLEFEALPPAIRNYKT